jgi:flagellin
MPQVINTNMMSLNTQRSLNTSQGSMQTSLERLSSGLRINRAKDDAAGLAISERLTAQIRGLEQANRNAYDGISLLQTAEGALAESTNALQRMRELAVQAANASVGASDKVSLDQEFQALASEIQRNATSTKFNGVQVIGTSTTLVFQIGYEAGSTSQIAVNTKDLLQLSGLTTAGGVTGVFSGAITTASGAGDMLNAIDLALDRISQLRADFGAAQNRLESTIRNNANITENQSAARSRILDADFAKETANLTRTQILQQAGTAMLAQANQLPQNVLQLLG